MFQGEEHELSGCVACLKGKKASKAYPSCGAKRATSRLELIHSDICGPMPIKSWGGAKYNMPRSTLESYLNKMRYYFKHHFVPIHIGLQHKTREEVVQQVQILEDSESLKASPDLTENYAHNSIDDGESVTEISTQYTYPAIPDILHADNEEASPSLLETSLDPQPSVMSPKLSTFRSNRSIDKIHLKEDGDFNSADSGKDPNYCSWTSSSSSNLSSDSEEDISFRKIKVSQSSATPKLKPKPSLFSWNHESEERKEIKRKRTERAYQRQKKRETATLASNKKENKCDEHFFFEETIEEIDIESSNKDVSVQCSLCKCEENLTNTAKLSEQGSNRKSTSNMFRIVNLKEKPDVIQFYTGFDNYNHFMLVFNLFGDEVNNLKYYPSLQPARGKHALTPPDQFYLTLIKIAKKYV
ncbi:hypothetical protein evm_010240 [Chilo suppressalis]|nr:hypothetical protein evm_010240 [Chilo suppressalis]